MWNILAEVEGAANEARHACFSEVVWRGLIHHQVMTIFVFLFSNLSFSRKLAFKELDTACFCSHHSQNIDQIESEGGGGPAVHDD